MLLGTIFVALGLALVRALGWVVEGSSLGGSWDGSTV